MKGVGTVADVDLAVRYGCQGVILSNHGGRELDFAPAPIDVLIELRQTRPDLFSKIEVYIDGGVRRGTDVLKAIALGATAVGLGRPFLVSVVDQDYLQTSAQTQVDYSTHSLDMEKPVQQELSR